MAACEALLEDLDPDERYPEEFVRFRITGFRSDRAGAGVLIVGEALRADLATFVLRLSGESPPTPDDRPGGALSLEALALRLGVAVRTLQRWRGLGLVQHWIDFGAEGRRVGCFEESVRAFALRHPELIDRGPRLTRLDAAERAAIVAAGEREARRGGSPSAIARRLAPRIGRSPEAIRQVLLAHEDALVAKGATPVRQLGERARRLIERAWRRGMPLREIATRLDRSEAAVHRQLAVRRRERLRALRLRWIELPTFELAEAESVILSAPAVRRGLRRLSGAEEAMALVTALRGVEREGMPGRDGADGSRRAKARRPPARRLARAPEAEGEDIRASADRSTADRSTADRATDERTDALVGAWNVLRRRAATAIAALPEVPRSTALDAIETDLRWATLVQQTLLAAALPEALRRIDAWAGRRVETLAADSVRTLLHAAISTVSAVIDRLDPGRGQRLDRVVALETDKALAKLGAGGGAAAGSGGLAAGGGSGGTLGSGSDGLVKATPRESRTIAMADPFAALLPWQAWLDPPRGWRTRLAHLPSPQRDAIVLHHGLEGAAPMPLAEIARALRVGVPAASRLVQDAEGRLRWPGARA